MTDAAARQRTDVEAAHVVTVRNGIHWCERCGVSDIAPPPLPCLGTETSALLIARWPTFPMETATTSDGHLSLRGLSAVEISDWFAATVAAAEAGAGERIALAIESAYLGPDSGRQYDGREAPDAALRNAYDEGLEHAAHIARNDAGADR